MSDDDENKTNNMEIRTLESEYAQLMNDRERVNKLYINSLTVRKNNTGSGSGTIEYDTRPSFTFWGSRPISDVENVSSVEDCEVECSNNEMCTGATFNSDQSRCWVRGGYGETLPGTSDDTAIVSVGMSYTQQLAEIDRDLKQVEHDLTRLRKPILSKYTSTLNHVTEAKKRIYNFDEKIENKAEEVEKIIDKHNQLSELDSDSYLYTNQQYAWFIIWLIIAILIIVVVIVQGSKITIESNIMSSWLYVLLSAGIIVGFVSIVKHSI